MRQWVLSLPRWARFLLARDAGLITRSLHVALREITRIRPPQTEQARISTAKTRLSKASPVDRARRPGSLGGRPWGARDKPREGEGRSQPVTSEDPLLRCPRARNIPFLGGAARELFLFLAQPQRVADGDNPEPAGQIAAPGISGDARRHPRRKDEQFGTPT